MTHPIRSLKVCVLCFVAFTSACTKKQNAGFGSERPVAKIDPATAANIRGKITLAGPIPQLRPIDMSADPGCRGSNSAETIVGQNDGLQNVFVYIKDGLVNQSFAVLLDPVSVAQDGCRYHPHVIAVMVGQRVDFFNADPTTHNIHASGQSNPQWNESQPPNAPLMEKTFANPEIMLPVKCNQHPWMRMYVNVVGHPFFAVSGEQGQYQIGGLPPGTYTLAFVHEKLGEQDVPVTIAPRENKTVDRTFKLP